MKLESFKDKKSTRRKMILISLGIITIVGVSLLLYKTFASFSSEVSFPMMSGKVNYYGNADLIFVFYNGEQELDEMPQKGNSGNLVFDYGTCDNGATIEWNEEKWAPLVKNLTITKTRCTLYFVKEKLKAQFPGKEIPLAEEGQDGLYAVEHNNLTELDSSWNKTEYRYAGVDPDNYVEFNGEKWRIIGLVNVKTESGVEQRVKIIRTDGIENQKDFGNYSWDRDVTSSSTNNWTKSKLKDMLNGTYYFSQNEQCYIANNVTAAKESKCDFSGNGDLPKGLDVDSRKMIDSEVIWNIGGCNTSYLYILTANKIYEYERGTQTGNNNDYPAEWSKETDKTLHKGIGLMYPSDYLYAIGEESENNCWLTPSSGEQWLLTPYSSYSNAVYSLSSNDISYGYVYYAEVVWPVGYLSTSVTIYDGDGSIGNPFKLRVD